MQSTSRKRGTILQQRTLLIPACSDMQYMYPTPGKRHKGHKEAQNALGHALSLRGWRLDEKEQYMTGYEQKQGTILGTEVDIHSEDASSPHQTKGFLKHGMHNSKGEKILKLKRHAKNKSTTKLTT